MRLGVLVFHRVRAQIDVLAIAHSQARPSVPLLPLDQPVRVGEHESVAAHQVEHRSRVLVRGRARAAVFLLEQRIHHGRQLAEVADEDEAHLLARVLEDVKHGEGALVQHRHLVDDH
eukprot:2470-Pleurochrysis_carterae.AAC.1